MGPVNNQKIKIAVKTTALIWKKNTMYIYYLVDV